MTSVRMFLADRALEAELRAFTGARPSGGGFKLLLTREPHFFEALEVEGDNPLVKC